MVLNAPPSGYGADDHRVCYEFGTKVSVAATINDGFIVGVRALPGNPYDGYALAVALEQVEVLTGRRPALAVVAATAGTASRPRGC